MNRCEKRKNCLIDGKNAAERGWTVDVDEVICASQSQSVGTIPSSLCLFLVSNLIAGFEFQAAQKGRSGCIVVAKVDHQSRGSATLITITLNSFFTRE
jgi:hypothetical protein